MNRILASVGLLTAFIANVPAQSNEQTECPAISITGPSYGVRPGELGTFSAKINAFGKEISPAFEWTISSGEIVSGQGTSSIEARWPRGESFTATVAITGLAGGCPNTASETAPTYHPPTAILLDEFFGSSTRSENKRFVRIVERSKVDPSSQLYAFIYGTTSSIKKKRNIVNRLIASKLGHDMRMTVVEAGTGKDRIVFWLVPPGAKIPSP